MSDTNDVNDQFAAALSAELSGPKAAGTPPMMAMMMAAVAASVTASATGPGSRLQVGARSACNCGCGKAAAVLIVVDGRVFPLNDQAELRGTVAALRAAGREAWPRRGPIARLRAWAGRVGRMIWEMSP